LHQINKNEGVVHVNQKEKDREISHVYVRELQAPLVSSLIYGFAREIGEDRAMEIAQKVINNDAVLSGKTLAKEVAGNSLADLMKAVQQIWAKDGAMKIENITLNARSLSFDVTYCGYAEIYEKLGIRELGSLMSCSRDFAFMDGFNPEIKLERSKTIMQGDNICDFRYVLKD